MPIAFYLVGLFAVAALAFLAGALVALEEMRG